MSLVTSELEKTPIATDSLTEVLEVRETCSKKHTKINLTKK